MAAPAVVPTLDPQQGLGPHLGDAPPTAAFYHLELVGPEPRFGDAVVPALSGAGKALSYMMFLKYLAELVRRILTGLNQSSQHWLVDLRILGY